MPCISSAQEDENKEEEAHPSSQTEWSFPPGLSANEACRDGNTVREVLPDDWQAKDGIHGCRARKCEQAEKESDEHGSPDAVHGRVRVPVDAVEEARAGQGTIPCKGEGLAGGRDEL